MSSTYWWWPYDQLKLPVPLAHLLLRCSQFGNQGWLDPDGFCYGPSVGYKIPDSVLEVTGYKQLAQAVLQGVTALLILHPVVAGLSLIGAATSLYLESHAMHIISLIVTIVNTFLSSIVFAADLAINIIAKDKVPALTGANLKVQWGNGVWLVAVGVVLSWLGVVLLSIPVCSCCGMTDTYHAWRGRRRKSYGSDSPYMTERYDPCRSDDDPGLTEHFRRSHD